MSFTISLRQKRNGLTLLCFFFFFYCTVSKKGEERGTFSRAVFNPISKALGEEKRKTKLVARQMQKGAKEFLLPGKKHFFWTDAVDRNDHPPHCQLWVRKLRKVAWIFRLPIKRAVEILIKFQGKLEDSRCKKLALSSRMHVLYIEQEEKSSRLFSFEKSEQTFVLLFSLQKKKARERYDKQHTRTLSGLESRK